jgi:hypothetical protein
LYFKGCEDDRLEHVGEYQYSRCPWLYDRVSISLSDRAQASDL